MSEIIVTPSVSNSSASALGKADNDRVVQQVDLNVELDSRSSSESNKPSEYIVDAWTSILAAKAFHFAPVDQQADSLADLDVPFYTYFHISDLVKGRRKVGFDFENHLNLGRLAGYKRELTTDFLAAIRDSEFEFGFDTLADRFVRDKLSENAMAIKEWLNDLFIENFNDATVVAGILKVVSHLDSSEISPQGQTMAVAALSHESNEIKELGIRAFENWGTQDSLSILGSVTVAEGWLQDYLADVIKDLSESLQNDATGTED